MPATTINRKNARRPRAGAAKRKNKQAARRPGSSGASKAAPAIIANSIFALVLVPKVALQVSESLSRKRPYGLQDDNYNEIYSQVLPIIQRAIYLVTKEETTFDPLQNGYDLSQAFGFIFNMFKTNVLPKGWYYNIETTSSNYQHEGPRDYHLVIYTGCEFVACWHCFEIKPVVDYYYTRNRRLHDMFIRFMANFCKHTGIDRWRRGGYSYVDTDYLREQVENYEWDSLADEETAKKDLENIIYEYEKGDAYWYEKFIENQPLVPVAQLKKELSRFAKNKLVKWMMAACDFMAEEWNINDFIYPEMDEENEGLMFDQQMTVIWNCRDRMTHEQEEYLDAEAQGCGIKEPVLTIRLNQDTAELDFKKLNEALQWPNRLTKLFQDYNKAIIPYERKDKPSR